MANVAENSHTAKPLIYKIAGVWGSHEGSMLLWCLTLTGYGAVIALGGDGLPARPQGLGRGHPGRAGRAVHRLYGVRLQPAAAPGPCRRSQGASLNPLLQDPFAGRPSAVPLRRLRRLLGGVSRCRWRRWSRAGSIRPGRAGSGPGRWRPWSLLTIGITLGSFWAYYELGWGGWWAWDPVENASFMPWLAATALLHSAVVTEKRGALAAWTVFLALVPSPSR